MPAPATFDPDRIARYKVAGWRAYYNRRWRDLLRLTVTLCQEQFRIPFPLSLVAAYHIVRASVAWVPVDHDLGRVRASLVSFYELAVRYAPLNFPPERVAAAELAYWTINRDLSGDRDDPRLLAALRHLHGAIFGLTGDEARESAVWRAQALVALDRITGGATTDAEADWGRCEEALSRCYRAIGRHLTAKGSQATPTTPQQANDYHFVTYWRVRATPEEVIDILADATDLPRWWPAVYLEVRQIAPGDERGIGQIVELHTKGWLPYTIRWRFRAEESDYPWRIAIAAEGDLNGRGVWSFLPDGDWTDIRYDWQIRGDKPLFRHLSFLLKPLFGANHRWAMARGAESLKLELRRRQATTDAERAAILAPPGPSTAMPFLVGLGSVLGVAALGVASSIRSRRQGSP